MACHGRGLTTEINTRVKIYGHRANRVFLTHCSEGSVRGAWLQLTRVYSETEHTHSTLASIFAMSAEGASINSHLDKHTYLNYRRNRPFLG